MLFLRRAVHAAIALPFALALAACGSDAAPEGEPPKGEAITRIAPPAGQDWTRTVAVSESGGYVMGNPNAPLKLVEYGSFTCSHCADFSREASAPLREKYVASGVVSFELRNQIHDGFDLTMAMLARCGQPEIFHALADQLWANFPSIVGGIEANKAAVEAAMNEADQAKRYSAIAGAVGLTDFFAARGISKDQAAVCLARPGFAEKIAKQSEDQSKELKIEGTPSFFLNDRPLGSMNWVQLEAILQQAGAR